MRVGRFVTIVMGLTVMALAYVALKVSLLTSSYDLRRLEQVRMERLDEHARLQYNLLSLSSPKGLEERLAKHRIKIAMPQRWEVIHLPQPVGSPQGGWGIAGGYRQFLSALVGAGKEAEARPIRNESLKATSSPR